MQQADRAHSATGTIASPGNIDNHSATRRGLLGFAAGLGAVAISAPIAAMPVMNRPWDVALARYRSASAAAERFHASNYVPAWQHIDAASGGSPQLDATIRTPGFQSRTIRVDTKAIYPDGTGYNAARAAQSELIGWFSRRNAAESRYSAILEHQDALWLTEDAARAALMTEPAPDAAALATKVLMAFEHEDIWANERDALMADARRLAA